jgi:ABC-type multidrug transport system fused ATPase/permease subunit
MFFYIYGSDFLEVVRSGRACLIVSHLARTIRAADLIVVMENGCLVESDDHASLLQSRGLYISLFGSEAKD